MELFLLPDIIETLQSSLICRLLSMMFWLRMGPMKYITQLWIVIRVVAVPRTDDWRDL